MGRINASGWSGRRTEKGRICLQKLTRLAVSEARVKQHQRQSEPFHLVKRLAVGHAPFVEGNEGQLELNADAVVKHLFRPGQNAPFVALHVDLQEQPSLLLRELTPHCIEPMLLNRLGRDNAGLRCGGRVAIEHGENGATGSGIPRDVEDDLRPTPSPAHTEQSSRAGQRRARFAEFGVRLRERLERDDSAAIAEAPQLCTKAAVACANVEDVVDLVAGKKLRTVVAGFVARKTADDTDRLDNPARAMEQRHGGRLDAGWFGREIERLRTCPRENTRQS